VWLRSAGTAPLAGCATPTKTGSCLAKSRTLAGVNGRPPPCQHSGLLLTFWAGRFHKIRRTKPQPRFRRSTARRAGPSGRGIPPWRENRQGIVRPRGPLPATMSQKRLCFGRQRKSSNILQGPRCPLRSTCQSFRALAAVSHLTYSEGCIHGSELACCARGGGQKNASVTRGAWQVHRVDCGAGPAVWDLQDHSARIVDTPLHAKPIDLLVSDKRFLPALWPTPGKRACCCA